MYQLLLQTNEPEMTAQSQYPKRAPSSNMTQSTSNNYIVPIISFNTSEANNFGKPVQSQDKQLNIHSSTDPPKIKIKDLKELQEPAIIKQAEGNKYFSDPNCNFLSHKAENVLIRSRGIFYPFTNQNVENETSYSQINHSQPSDEEATYRNVKLRLKERLLKERLSKLENKRDLISSLTSRGRSLLFSSKPHSSTEPGSEPLILEGRPKPVVKRKDDPELKSYVNENLPVLQIETSNKPVKIEKYGFHNTVGFTNHSLQNPDEEARNCFEFIGVGESAFVGLETDSTVEPVIVTTSCSQSINRQGTGLGPNVFPKELPTIEISKEVDSTGLRDGIIKASRTLINTEKTLKFLLQILSRDESLPPQKAARLIKRFQSVLTSFNRKFDDIDQTVKNEYKHLFPNFDFSAVVQQPKAKESLVNSNQKREIIIIEDGDCGVQEIITEQPNSFIYKSRWQALCIGEETDNRVRKKRQSRAHMSDDEELDKSFQPVQARNMATTSCRQVPQRSCRKRQICLVDETQESEDEGS